jgi:hypothetical protein
MARWPRFPSKHTDFTKIFPKYGVDMKLSELTEMLPGLVAEYGAELKVGVAIVVSLILLAVLVVVMQHKRTDEDEPVRGKPEATRPESKPVTPTPVARAVVELEEAPKPQQPVVEAPRPAPVVVQQIKAAEAAAPTTAAVPVIPQDSVLRRHYLSHVRYMVEATTFPRPTDSVLRRHYEQLVGSVYNACISDTAEMQKLLRRYDDYRREAFKAAA